MICEPTFVAAGMLLSVDARASSRAQYWLATAARADVVHSVSTHRAECTLVRTDECYSIGRERGVATLTLTAHLESHVDHPLGLSIYVKYFTH